MRRFVFVPTVLGALSSGALGAGSARADQCGPLRVEVDTRLGAERPELAREIEGELANREGLDRCAEVRISLGNAGGIAVHVSLPDGRATSRHGLRERDVVPTLSGLLLVPADETTPPVAAPDPDDTEHDEPTGVQREPTRTMPPASRDEAPPELSARDATTAPAEQPSGFGVELSLFSGARAGDGQGSVGLGALSFVSVDGWLLGFQGRGDQYQPFSSTGPLGVLELAALFGRRFPIASFALDVVGGPAVTSFGMVSDVEAVSRTEAPPRPPPPEESSEPVPRLLLAAHLGFAPQSVLGGFVGVEGAISQRGAASDGVVPGTQGVPRWTVGLVAGATVGTR